MRSVSSAAPGPSDFWQKTISQIPTRFGRLVYLASLRVPGEGRYEHWALAQIAGEKESGQLLQRSHKQVFSDWLSLGQQDQKRDLAAYLSALGKNRLAVIQTWIDLAPYRHLPPSSATQGEIQRYVKGVDLLLKSLVG